MALTQNDLKAFRSLIREEIRSEVFPRFDEMERRFDEIHTQIDGLYLRDERREVEYLSMREQIKRLEERIA